MNSFEKNFTETPFESGAISPIGNRELKLLFLNFRYTKKITFTCKQSIE